MKLLWATQCSRIGRHSVELSVISNLIYISRIRRSSCWIHQVSGFTKSFWISSIVDGVFLSLKWSMHLATCWCCERNLLPLGQPSVLFNCIARRSWWIHYVVTLIEVMKLDVFWLLLCQRLIYESICSQWLLLQSYDTLWASLGRVSCIDPAWPFISLSIHLNLSSSH